MVHMVAQMYLDFHRQPPLHLLHRQQMTMVKVIFILVAMIVSVRMTRMVILRCKVITPVAAEAAAAAAVVVARNPDLFLSLVKVTLSNSRRFS